MGDRADPIGACGIEKEAGGQSFESFKVKVVGGNCLTEKRVGSSERVF